MPNLPFGVPARIKTMRRKFVSIITNELLRYCDIQENSGQVPRARVFRQCPFVLFEERFLSI